MAHHKKPPMNRAAASSNVFVRQIRWRDTGCASSIEKVPELISAPKEFSAMNTAIAEQEKNETTETNALNPRWFSVKKPFAKVSATRSEEHTSELQSPM